MNLPFRFSSGPAVFRAPCRAFFRVTYTLVRILTTVTSAKTLTDMLAFCEFSFGPDIRTKVAILAQGGLRAMSEAAAM